MAESPSTSSRKQDHLRINLEKDVSSALSTGLENYRFVHEALPEINLDEIDLSQTLFGKRVAAPLLISSMTGGTDRAKMLNRTLARAAQQAGVAMGVGSQRAALEKPELRETFQVRKYAPGILLLANLGAIQLNYGYSVDDCKRAVDMVQADALILHLNSLQEAIQPEGDTHFAGLARKIELVCRSLPVPVIAKEVGWGISSRTAHRLVEAGVAGIDVAGAGGTSWTQVEMHRLPDESRARVAAAFRNWGIPTSESIQLVRKAAPQLPIIASGGLRDGIDVAKCIALGATLGGLASPFLKAAWVSLDEVIRVIQEICDEVRICMFGVGAPDLPTLKRAYLVRTDVR